MSDSGYNYDDFGCLSAEGYTWCENQKKCLRLLKEDCTNGTVEDVNVTISGDDEDIHGCVASAGYVWCEKLGNCVQDFELNGDWDQECVFNGDSYGNDSSLTEVPSSDDTLSYIFNEDVFADPKNALCWILAACSILCMSMPLCYLFLNKICGWHKKRCARLQLIVDGDRVNNDKNNYICEEDLSVNV
jgi:hypothetical protein